MLTPPLLLLRRIKLPRVVAVSIVVGAAFAIILVLGWVISREVTQLASNLPSYQYTLSEKIKSLRESIPHTALANHGEGGRTLSELQKELATPEVEPGKSKVGADAAHPDDKPMQVEIREHEPSGMELFQRIAGTVLPPLATAGIILLFVVFILYQREDLELAPGWVVDESILCIGGRSALDEAAAAILAEVLKKRGLGAKALGPNAISAAHIASLARAEAKLVCLSYLGLGKSPAHVRYVVRRLRRILTQGTAILVCYWSDEDEAPAAKQLLEAAEADAYATSLPHAVELYMAAAKGELKRVEVAKEPTPPPRVTPFLVRDNAKRRQKVKTRASMS